MDGIVLVDKPADWTSFDVVAKLRGQLRAQTGNKKIKVGHAGTLDPFATGLLIILVGTACKQADTLLKLDKTYEFTARLGVTSTTGDTEGELTTNLDAQEVSAEAVEAALEQFIGDISQIPPMYSAIKVGGKRAYDLARAGKEVVMEPRNVTIYSLELTSYSWPEVSFVAHVGSGTYIRTLAEDIGKALGVGAYCTKLRRTQIASFEVEEAKTIEELTVIHPLPLE
jgi:tRNA pseudouridine55 synthase